METEDIESRGVSQPSEGGMKTYRFRFKIDARKFAANFGVDIPDDSSDTGLVAEDAADECVAEDAATVRYPRQVKATLDQCRAKNPMFCPYHGMQAVGDEIEMLLRGAGVSGAVKCNVDGVTGGVLSVTATVTAPASDEKKIHTAMQSFFALPGVSPATDMEYEGGGKVSGMFDLDMLDKNAVARWGFAQKPQPAPAPAPQPQPPPQPASPPQPVPQPQPAPQSQPPPQPQAQPQPAVKRTRSRKQTGKALQQQPVAAEPPKEEPAPQATASSGSGDYALPADDDPELYPNIRPPKPPDHVSPFSPGELDSLEKMAVRLVKTAGRINSNIENGKTDAWLAKTAPNLPKSLVKFKNEVDGSLLSSLASKDTDGQVVDMKGLFDEIEASESAGWKTKVAEDKWDPNADRWWEPGKKGNVDVRFDRSKYDDPYAKEREEYDSFKDGADVRKATLGLLKQIDGSKEKDAPKDAADACRKAAQDMSDIEDGFAVLESEGIRDPETSKVLAQEYYKANERFKEAEKACREWISSRRLAQDSIQEVIEAHKRMGIEVPAELDNMQTVEDEVKERGWDKVAKYHGLDRNDPKLLENFRNNMRAYFQKCPTCSSYDITDICNQILENKVEYTKRKRDPWTGKRIPGRTCKNNHRFHAGNNSYVITQNAVFGLQETPYKKNSSLKMHAYGTVCGMPFCDVPSSMMYTGSNDCCTMLVNPKQAPIAFFGEYGSTADYFRGSSGDPKNRSWTGSYVNNASPSIFACTPSGVSKKAFTDDLSHLDFADLQKALGFHHQTGEAWMIGGIHENAILAIKEQKPGQMTKERIDAFNAKGITILDVNGKVIGNDYIPDDPDLVKLVWGDKGRPQ